MLFVPGEIILDLYIDKIPQVQRHPEKLPEVTDTSRGNPGFPAATQERPQESFFNVS